MVPQASEKCCLLPPEHQQIGCCTSNSLNSEQVPGTFSTLTISSLALQASAEIVIRFLTPFLATGLLRATSCMHVAVHGCCAAGFLHWTLKGAGHEWCLRLPRSAVFFLPITLVSVAARATASIRNRFLAPSSYSCPHRSLYRHHIEPRKHS